MWNAIEIAGEIRVYHLPVAGVQQAMNRIYRVLRSPLCPVGVLLRLQVGFKDGFLSNTVYAFALLATAHGALLAGQLANRIFFLGAILTDFKVEIAIVLIFMLCVVLGSLLVFAPQLAQAKRTGLREYGTLAERYVREFDAKWLRGGAPADEPFVGSADIQSLADLGNSYEVVRTMRSVPITREIIFQLVVATLAPLVPLALTMMSLEDLLKTLFGVLF